ncbi:MAG: N-acetylmuramoyl-L-alanine amidase [Cardiobacteriaceae bacterium]|nr:N-acetylmuramoyl-L-alanine amidase [Cardiobacteriaceae bacterium]
MRRFWLAVSLVFFAAYAQAAVVVEGIRANRLPDKVQIVLDLNAPTVFQQFSLPDPPRIVLDIPDARRSGRAGLVLNDGPVNSVRSGFRTQEMLRVVIDLNDVVKANIYTLKPEANRGNRIVVDVYDRSYDPALTLSSLDEAQVPFVVFAGGPLDTRQQLNDMIASAAPPVAQKPAPTGGAGSVSIAAPPPIAQTPVQPPVQQPLTPDVAIVSPPPVQTAKPAPAPPLTVERNISASGKVQKQVPVAPPAGASKKNIVVVIDPGHGGKDPGAVSRATGLQEKVAVLAISKRLKRLLDAKPGYRAILTRDRDVFIPLRDRTAIARRHKADLFVSIHADAVEGEGPRGSSVYMLSTKGASSQMARYLANRENAVDLKWGVDVSKYDNDIQEALLDIQLDATLESSSVFGRHVISELGKVGHTHKRNVERANFVVLRSPEIPSLLVETAFISNPEDARLLASPAYQDKLARGIASGIESYFREHLPQHMLLGK